MLGSTWTLACTCADLRTDLLLNQALSRPGLLSKLL